ncbi:MAG: 23S rRNA (adenine(2503)-C(2))-methyltransferase RlmN [Defluviitaleaceae bacterium]|nr:23S rRNA (adenine(2503)-C(2))-methyltransferase RlmN [Defluviitaleaceae bacterium]
MQDILSLNLIEIENILISFNEPKYRAKQIFNWLHKNMVTSFDEMTNISKKLRDILSYKFYIPNPEVLEELHSKDESVKYLFSYGEDTLIETVLMKNSYGYTICVSTQVGCKMGCTFCASHLAGFKKNLTAGEILAQVYSIQKKLKQKISNIVIMGIGEPLDNYEASIRFIKNLSNADGLNISQRNITISTCGVVPRIYDLANEGLSVTLAISIHAGDDIVRKKIMPIANKYSIEEIFQATKYYFEKTKRRVSYEYALIKDVNDGKEQANKIAKNLRGTPSHINLIPLNSVSESGYEGTAGKQIKEFYNILQSQNISTTIRISKGQDINAACGQLRRSKELA